MSAIEAIANREYKYGFVTDIESETIPRGLTEDTVRLISSKEERARVDARVSSEGLSPLAEDDRAEHWANFRLSEDRFSEHHLLFGARSRKRRKQSLDEVDPELLETFEKLGIPLTEQKMLANVAVDAVFDSVSVATTYKEKLAKGGRDLLLVYRGGRGLSGADQEVSRLGRAGYTTTITRR